MFIKSHFVSGQLLRSKGDTAGDLKNLKKEKIQSNGNCPSNLL